jgi:hypothetical protein
MNKEIVRFRDKDPDGCGSHDIVVDAQFRFPLSKAQRQIIENVAGSSDYDPGCETLQNYAEAVLNRCMEYAEFKDDGQRWRFVEPDIVVEIEV